MKHLRKCMLTIALTFIVAQVMGFTSEIKTITLSDKEKVTARLCLPEGKDVKTIVVAVHGTGPHTYLVKRQGFNYYDVLAEGFCEQGVGFFTYNRRGVELGDTPPWFDKVDSIKYAKYLPHIEAADIETMIANLKKDKRFRNCKIILYGISEGTIIASMVAERQKAQVDALFLHGYAHDNLYDIIEWQDSGESTMQFLNSLFDKNKDNVISREEYGQADSTIRKYAFQSMVFDSIDVIKDNIIDIKDIGKMRGEFHKTLMTKIAENDGAWIWNSYVRVTVGWLREHFALEPNKTRLLRVNIPIYIFHGAKDANVPVSGVYDLQDRFKACAKPNLTVHVFETHNHDLNFQNWLNNKKYSKGFRKIFETAKNIWN